MNRFWKECREAQLIQNVDKDLIQKKMKKWLTCGVFRSVHEN